MNNNHYWVSDSDSIYYNQLVDISKTSKKWNSAEHLISYTKAYKYAIAINFNTSYEPGAGSAIFLHCNTGNATGGCIAIDEKYMIYTLKNLKNNAKIIIDYSNKIKEY